MSSQSRLKRQLGAEAFAVGPFQRLARTQMLSVAGDTLLAVALADSLFFNVDPNDARWKVATYLVLTLAPFAVVAPLLSPLMDRVKGGHRYMIIGSAAVRALVMFALVRYIQGPLLFPLAFSMLVMGKTYAIAKSALVPVIVTDHEALVRANARLTVLAGVAGAAAGVPGILLLQIGGAPLVLIFGSLVFVGAAVMATRIPALTVAPGPPEPEEKAELRSAGIVLAGSAMGYLRSTAGFITLLLAFELRGGIDPGPTAAGVQVGHRVRESLGLQRLDLTSGGAPAWHFGVAILGAGAGGLVAAMFVPRLRTMFREERILAQSLFGLAGLCALASLATGVVGAFLAGAAVSMAGTAGKQAFDAIVQRDAPKANLGRSFGQFESRFQLLWVVGALIPVVAPVPARAGYLLVVVTALFVGLSYWFEVQPDPRVLLNDKRLAPRIALHLRHWLPGKLRQHAPAQPATAAQPPPAAEAAPAAEPATRAEPTSEAGRAAPGPHDDQTIDMLDAAPSRRRGADRHGRFQR
jgi:hypothetical protein